MLQALSLLSGFVCAGLVLLLVWGRVEGQEVAAVAGPEERADEVETAPGLDVGALRARILEIVAGHGGVYGVAMLDPASGTRMSLRGDEEFMTASVGKLPTLAALYRAAARGEVDLEKKIPVLPEDVRTGAGGLKDAPPGYSLSLREYAYRLVNHSDNTAWVMLDRRLGEERIRAELGDMGIDGSRYHGYLSGYYATPDEVLVLLEHISDPGFTSEELSVEMLDAMTKTDVEDRLPGKLPPDVRVAHKTGSYGGNFGDAGIVFYKDPSGRERRCYLVVLASGAGEGEARDAIQHISLAVYEALTSTRVDLEWSRRESSAPREDEAAGSPAIQPSPPNAGAANATPGQAPSPDRRYGAVPSPPPAPPSEPAVLTPAAPAPPPVPAVPVPPPVSPPSKQTVPAPPPRPVTPAPAPGQTPAPALTPAV